MTYLKHPNKRDYFMTQCKLEPRQIQTIQKFTVAQAQSLLWLAVRRGRITSSNFGGAISLARRNVDPTQSFTNYLLKSKDISKMPAVKYGIDYESTAVQDYENAFEKKVVRCGIFMSECGMLGGSPDGLVDDDGIIEIKCPYKIKDINSANDLSRLGYLHKNHEGHYELSDTHKYYHQVQGNLYVTNRSYCDFIVWSAKLLYCIRILRDPTWEQNIGLMQTYYIEKVLPCLENFYCDDRLCNQQSTV